MYALLIKLWYLLDRHDLFVDEMNDTNYRQVIYFVLDVLSGFTRVLKNGDDGGR